MITRCCVKRPRDEIGERGCYLENVSRIICHLDLFDKPFDFAQGHELGRMAQGELRERS